MTVVKPTNLAASVRQRLRNLASFDGSDFDRILRRYANERLLYRLLSVSGDEQFVLKGAMLWTVWEGRQRRPTRDVDLLCADRASPGALRKVMRAACAAVVEPDGLVFDATAVAAKTLREGHDYKAVRIRGSARLDSARMPIQVDVGFGDVVTPAPMLAVLPPLLRFPPVRMRVYPPETVVAEKVDAMLKLEYANTRMKDFYDVWALSETHEFQESLLHRALHSTFARRGTQVPPGEVPLAFTTEFASNPKMCRQWAQFLGRNKLHDAPSSLGEVVDRLSTFLLPLMLGTGTRSVEGCAWRPGQGWERAPGCRC